MPKILSDRPNTRLGLILIFSIIIVLAGFGLKLWLKKMKKPGDKKKTEKVTAALPSRPVIDYNKLEDDDKLKSLMRKRKAKYGVEKGIDMIVKSDESIKVGDSTISMEEIQEKIRLNEGEIIEKDIEEKTGQNQGEKIRSYGIYVVRSGNNVWNIHFKFLRDYFERKGISLSPLADEPDRLGYSSGVGKILKFSENMVYIYNLREKKISVDLNQIYPLSKIIIYKMDQIFNFLNEIDYNNVNRIQFDGETLWIPPEQ